jgi:hypothetical protein
MTTVVENWAVPAGDTAPPSARGLSLAALIGLFVVIAGLLIGLGPLNDNSFLTHLATGRIIVEQHTVPSHDPYSWTAPGHAWVVQSWLATIAYGLADKAGGAEAVQLLVGLTAGAIAALVWTLTRPARAIVGRLVVALFVVGVGLGFWVERPLLFGLVGLCACLLAAEGRLDPRWLIPIMWGWVNVHGSFPLGLVALALFAAGTRLDGERPSRELAALKWAAIGTAAGVLNPYGLHLLTFPVELLRRQDVLRYILEWQAPKFRSLSERVFLVELVVAVVALCRHPRWRVALPLAVFAPVALLGARNIVVASIVLAPGLAAGLSGLGTVEGHDRRPIHRIAAVVLVAFAVLAAAVAWNRPIYRLGGYPTEAVTWLEQRGDLRPGVHVVAPDFVGNYLEFRYGPRRMVFIDDRYDMYPTDLVEDYVVLNRGGRGWDAILDKYQPEIVIWQVDEPLGQLLSASPRWRVIHTDSHEEWLIAEPVGE